VLGGPAWPQPAPSGKVVRYANKLSYPERVQADMSDYARTQTLSGLVFTIIIPHHRKVVLLPHGQGAT